jgi:hypothetical protein
MGSPYLSSGESITMTTHRVSVDSIPYDVMLTTHRLTLIDSRYARFEPLMIAFEDILTVKSGAASTGEPVIIMTYTGADETAREMNLIFSQQPGEHRKQERDLWVKKLMGSIIAEREDPAVRDEGPAIETDGMQPSVRRWVAPEGIALRTPFAVKEAVSPEITIIPDDEGDLFERSAPRIVPEGSAGGMTSDQIKMGRLVEDSSRISPEPERALPFAAKYDYGETDEEGEDEFIPAPSPDRDPLHKFHEIVIPFVPVSEPVRSVSSEQKDTEEAQKEIPSETIRAAVHSLIPKEPAKTPGDEARTAEKPAGEISPGIRAATVPQPVAVRKEKKSRRKKTVSSSSAGPEPLPADSQTSPTNEPAGDMKQEEGQLQEPAHEEHPAIHEETAAVPEDPGKTSRAGRRGKSRKQSAPAAGTSSAKVQGSQGVPEGKQSSGRRTPREPDVSAKGSHRGMVAVIIVIIVLLALTGATVLLLNNTTWINGTSQGPSTVPTTTIQPTVTPAAPTAIPSTRTGVRVIYPGNFIGEVGNPGSMKPVTGTGDAFFPVTKKDGLVQASIQKQDNSGNNLTVEVYNNGNIIYAKSASTPMGSVDFLIDGRTGTVPGMTPVETTVNQTVTSRPIYY